MKGALQGMTVEEIYHKVDKTKEHWSIWVFSADGMEQAYTNDYYKFDAVSKEIKESEVDVITIGSGSLFLKI